MTTKRLTTYLVLLMACIVLTASEMRADTFTFSTTELSSFTGPFSVNFQFVDSNAANNMVTLTNTNSIYSVRTGLQFNL